jgi:hypothetical protein
MDTKIWVYETNSFHKRIEKCNRKCFYLHSQLYNAVLMPYLLTISDK